MFGIFLDSDTAVLFESGVPTLTLVMCIILRTSVVLERNKLNGKYVK